MNSFSKFLLRINMYVHQPISCSVQFIFSCFLTFRRQLVNLLIKNLTAKGKLFKKKFEVKILLQYIDGEKFTDKTIKEKRDILH